jgi:hypothetical protein
MPLCQMLQLVCPPSKCLASSPWRLVSHSVRIAHLPSQWTDIVSASVYFLSIIAPKSVIFAFALTLFLLPSGASSQLTRWWPSARFTSSIPLVRLLFVLKPHLTREQIIMAPLSLSLACVSLWQLSRRRSRHGKTTPSAVPLYNPQSIARPTSRLFLSDSPFFRLESVRVPRAR